MEENISNESAVQGSIYFLNKTKSYTSSFKYKVSKKKYFLWLNLRIYYKQNLGQNNNNVQNKSTVLVLVHKTFLE